MSVRKAFFGLVLVVVLVVIGTFFNQPKSPPFPFAKPLELLPDYRPPGEGVTLYPTGGPFGLDVIEAITLGVDGAIYVGTFGGGLFKSSDEGGHWQPVNRGLRDKFISTLFVLEDGKLFAGTIRAGLFMSRDHGAHWTSVNLGLENTDVTTMIKRASGELLAGTGQGVYISRNEGKSWEPFNQGLDHTQIKSIAEDKSHNLYVGTQGVGIFKREPKGEKWFPIVNGFSFKGLEERIVRTMVFGRNNVLYAGTMSSGIFRSASGGSQWEDANRGLQNLSIRTLTADRDGVLYAGTGEGVYFSRNNGEQWNPLFNGMSNVQIHSFFVNEKGGLYAGSSSGLYSGTIQKAWRPLHDSLLISPILSLAYGENRITAGTEGKGTYVDNEDNWMSDNLGLVNLTIRALARGNIFLYALTEEGVYRRQMGRHQWSVLDNVPDSDPIAVAVDAMDRVYLGTSEGLFLSSDHGAHWVKETDVGSEPIRAFALGADIFFAAGANKIWSNTLKNGSAGPPSAGSTLSPETAWENIITQDAGGEFQSILWRPGKGLLVMKDQNLWERDLSGVWRALEKSAPAAGARMISIAVDPHNSDLLYAGTDRGLFWSTDNGGSWERADLYQGEIFEGKINQVLTTDSSAIWLATEADGVLLGISKVARRNFFKRWFGF